MKKLTYLLISLGAILNNISFAQTSCINGGQNILNVYYGTDFTKQGLQVMYEGEEQLQVTGSGNLGLVFEHVVNRRIGIGGEFGYSNSSASFIQTPYVPASKLETYSYSHTMTHIRAQLRMDFYFLNTKHYNAYGFAAGGYSNYMEKLTSNAPGTTNENQSSAIPVGIKTGIGFRYFSDRMGFFAEMALGTPLLNVGISAKF